MLLEEIKNIPSSKEALKKFGLTLGIFFALVAAFLFWKQKEGVYVLAGLSAFFLFFAFAAPQVLKPIQTVWMSLAFVMGWFMTKVILAVLFYGVMTPIGLTTKILGKDLLNQKFPGGKDSYWIPYPPKTKDSYLNQF